MPLFSLIDGGKKLMHPTKGTLHPGKALQLRRKILGKSVFLGCTVKRNIWGIGFQGIQGGTNPTQ